MKRGLAILLLSFLVALPALAADAPAYRDGTYALDYQDPELGNVSVSVVVDQGKISSVTFPKGKGDVALEDADLESWLKTFIAAPDLLAVDALSGATQSCDLVKYAVAAALKGAALK